MDYFSREGFTISDGWYRRDVNALNTKAVIAYIHDSYKPMDELAGWSVFGGAKDFRPQPYTPKKQHQQRRDCAGNVTLPPTSYMQHGWNVAFTLGARAVLAQGDFNFTQMVLDARRFQPIAEWLNLNLRARFGASDGIVPFQRQFEIGGVSTLPVTVIRNFMGATSACSTPSLSSRIERSQRGGMDQRSSFHRKHHPFLRRWIDETKIP